MNRSRLTAFWIVSVATLMIVASSAALAGASSPTAGLSEADVEARQAWHRDVDAYLAHQRIKFSSYFQRAMADAGNQPRENVVIIDYTADRAGAITSAQITRTSGFPSLDKAALHFIDMSSPVPAASGDVRVTEEHFAIELVFVAPNAIRNLQQQRLGGDQ
jgi:TonB family protein